MKMKLQSEAAFDPTFLSVMDTTFMLFYAIGSFFSGTLGDLFPAPLIVSVGLIGASLCMFIFACLVSFDIERSGNELLRTFTPLFLWMIHGLMQSTGGPANTSIMSHWFGYKHRGYVFGSWTTHQYVGNILSALLASFVLSFPGIPWTLVFFIPAVLALFWGLFCLKNLPDRPENVEGLHNLLKGEGVGDDGPPGWTAVMPSITLFEAIRIPNVIGYSLAFGLFKFFWLPFYLSQSYQPQTGNLVSIVYDLGNIPGGILVGYISDVYKGRRACVIATFTCASIPFLLLISKLSEVLTSPTYLLFAVLAFLGVCIGGPINIITSAVAIDLAENSSVGGRSDLMLLTGFINGCGSIIAALGLLLIGPIISNYGWTHVWNILIGSTAVGTLLLSPAIFREIRRAHFDSLTEEQDFTSERGSRSLSSSNDLHTPPSSALKSFNGVYSDQNCNHSQPQNNHESELSWSRSESGSEDELLVGSYQLANNGSDRYQQRGSRTTRIQKD